MKDEDAILDLPVKKDSQADEERELIFYYHDLSIIVLLSTFMLKKKIFAAHILNETFIEAVAITVSCFNFERTFQGDFCEINILAGYCPLEDFILNL